MAGSDAFSRGQRRPWDPLRFWPRPDILTKLTEAKMAADEGDDQPAAASSLEATTAADLTLEFVAKAATGMVAPIRRRQKKLP